MDIIGLWVFDMRVAVGGDLDARETFLMLLNSDATDVYSIWHPMVVVINEKN